MVWHRLAVIVFLAGRAAEFVVALPDCSATACPSECTCAEAKCTAEINACLGDPTCAAGQRCGSAPVTEGAAGLAVRPEQVPHGGPHGGDLRAAVFAIMFFGHRVLGGTPIV